MTTTLSQINPYKYINFNMGPQSNSRFGGFPPYNLNCCKLQLLENVRTHNAVFCA